MLHLHSVHVHVVLKLTSWNLYSIYRNSNIFIPHSFIAQHGSIASLHHIGYYIKIKCIRRKNKNIHYLKKSQRHIFPVLFIHSCILYIVNTHTYSTCAIVLVLQLHMAESRLLFFKLEKFLVYKKKQKRTVTYYLKGTGEKTALVHFWWEN